MAFFAKLVSGDDHQVSLLHVALVAGLVLFSLPVFVLCGIAVVHAFNPHVELIAHFGADVQFCAGGFASVIAATGGAFWMKGNGTKETPDATVSQ